ncbi:MAG TPA: polysaccharide deacetylase family protein [Nevskiaceae bacterium]
MLWPLLLLAAAALHPSWWLWLLIAFAVNHLLLAAAGCWPRCRWLGPNVTRLPAAAARRGEVAITFDDGPDPVLTPWVLDCLARHGAHATFFVRADRAAAAPELIREMLRLGHDVQNHSWRHGAAFALYGWRRLGRELQRSQEILGTVCGRPPSFFRAPAGVRSPLLEPRLAGAGLRLVSWTRRGFDTVDPDAPRVLRRLERHLAPGDILLLHDGRGRGCHGVPLRDVLPQLLARVAARGLMTVTLSAAWSPAKRDAAVSGKALRVRWAAAARHAMR